MRRRLLLLALAAAVLVPLAGCATPGTKPEPQIRTVEVFVPVPRSCVPKNLSPKPIFRVTKEGLQMAPDAAERLRLAVIGFLEREDRLNTVEPVVDKCRD